MSTLNSTSGGTPNFFIVGAPKCGTTSLYHYLDQHPQIYMSPIKEPHYVADEIRLENFTEEMRRRTESRLPALRTYLHGPMKAKFWGGPASEFSDYLKLFQHARTEKAIGEASVCCLWSKTAPGNIATLFPRARIIIILRDPTERAYSQYLHMLTFARSAISFSTFMSQSMNSKGTRIGELYPFLEFGLYCEQIRRYFTLFPRDYIRIYFYEDYQRN